MTALGHHVLALKTSQQPLDVLKWVGARQKGPLQAFPSLKCLCSAISKCRVSRNQIPSWTKKSILSPDSCNYPRMSLHTDVSWVSAEQ